MTDDNDRPRQQTGTADARDRLIRGAAVGSSVVLILFLVIAGAVYYTTDYEFASVSEPGAAPPLPTEPPSDTRPPSGLDGQAIAQRTGCVACHSTDGSVLVGPSWQGLIGSERTFDDGSSLVVDAEYLRESIVNPAARVVEGFQAIMPQTYEDILSDAEIDAVVEYISSL